MKPEQFVFVWLDSIVTESPYRGVISGVVHLRSELITIIWEAQSSALCSHKYFLSYLNNAGNLLTQMPIWHDYIMCQRH